MFLIAAALMSLGYTIAYWGINNIVSWQPEGQYGMAGSSLSNGTRAVELGILMGIQKEATQPKVSGLLLNRHEVPFAYYPTTASGGLRPISGTPTTPSPTTPAKPNANPVIPV